MSEAPSIPKTHNLPPVVAPLPEEALADLNQRYGELATKREAFEKALATYPDALTLKDEDVAGSLQDLLGQIKKHKAVLAAYKKEEKKPWDGIVKVVQNFFAKEDESMEAMLEKWTPVHQDFLTQKAEKARADAEAEAERQRKIEEEARAAAARAEEERQKKEAEAEAARKREEEARAAAAKAEEERQAAEQRRLEAEAEERRLADERKKRDREERARNEENLVKLRRHMKEAAKLHEAGVEEETSQADIDQLDALIKPGGIMGVLAAPVFASGLLTPEQLQEIEIIRSALGNMRQVLEERLGARDRRKREKERKAQEDRDNKAAEERRVQREAEDQRLRDATAAREREEAEASRLREERLKNEATAKESAGTAKQLEKDAKAAGKDVKASTTEADRAGNRATRTENRLENTTDGEFSRTRGDLGTVGSLTRRWNHYIEDEAKLRGVCGPLAEHFNSDDLNGAVYRWMVAHRSSFTGERVVPKELPGVVFAYEQGDRIG